MQASWSTRPLLLDNENLEILWPGTPTNFPREYLGYDQDHLLYTFFQVSPDHPEGWAGTETFRRPPSGVHVAAGYGALPLRLWGHNFIAEDDGQVAASQGFYAPRFYLSNPAYEDYGGIHPRNMSASAYIELAGNGDLRFVSPQVPLGLSLSELAGGPPSPPAAGDSTLPLLALIGLLAVAAVAASHGNKKMVVFK